MKIFYLIRKFADAMNIDGVMDNEEDWQNIQQDTDQLKIWAE